MVVLWRTLQGQCPIPTSPLYCIEEKLKASFAIISSLCIVLDPDGWKEKCSKTKPMRQLQAWDQPVLLISSLANGSEILEGEKENKADPQSPDMLSAVLAKKTPAHHPGPDHHLICGRILSSWLLIPKHTHWVKTISLLMLPSNPPLCLFPLTLKVPLKLDDVWGYKYAYLESHMF